jgi:hypothetical protein
LEHRDDDNTGNGSSDDLENVYTKLHQQDHCDPKEADMQQAAMKRQLPLLPPLDMTASSSTEEIMGKLHELNVAKKSKLTPRGGNEE